MNLWLLLLLALLLSLPAYALGYRTAQRNHIAPGNEPPILVPTLEVIEVFESGNVYWRYGPGQTVLTGYCHRNYYPNAALEKIGEHLKEQQREQAIDALLDQYLP